MLPAARTFTPEQSRQNPDNGVQAAAGAGELDAGDHGRTILFAQQIEDSRQAKQVDVVRGTIPVRSILSEAGQRTVDEPRMDLLQCVIAQTDPFHASRTKGVDQNVGFRKHRQKDIAAGRILQVQGHGTLVAVDDMEITSQCFHQGGHLAESVRPPRIFDLHDIGAEVCQHLAAERSGKKRGQVEHTDSL
jgi:hypothetical protein